MVATMVATAVVAAAAFHLVRLVETTYGIDYDADGQLFPVHLGIAHLMAVKLGAAPQGSAWGLKC